MNQNASFSSTQSPARSPSAEDISRHAYEIWEREGRPDGCDLRHWLQAEQELTAPRATEAKNAPAPNPLPATSREAHTDARPLQGTRAAAAANREPKRPTAAPFGDRLPAAGNGASAKRKSPNTPAL